MTLRLPLCQPTRRRWQGFSLIELLVTVAIIGVMFALGAASFGSTVRKARERTIVQKFVGDVAWARGLASRKGVNVTGASRVQIVLGADCTWATTTPLAAASSGEQTAHSMSAAEIAAQSAGIACAGSNGLALPATFTFNADGSVSTSGNITFTGTTETWVLRMLFSGSVVRQAGAN